jgi:hypothetical protein
MLEVQVEIPSIVVGIYLEVRDFKLPGSECGFRYLIGSSSGRMITYFCPQRTTGTIETS